MDTYFVIEASSFKPSLACWFLMADLQNVKSAVARASRIFKSAREHLQINGFTLTQSIERAAKPLVRFS